MKLTPAPLCVCGQGGMSTWGLAPHTSSQHWAVPRSREQADQERYMGHRMGLCLGLVGVRVYPLLLLRCQQSLLLFLPEEK
jgi:hypothetical protein